MKLQEHQIEHLRVVHGAAKQGLPCRSDFVADVAPLIESGLVRVDASFGERGAQLSITNEGNWALLASGQNPAQW